MFEMSPNKIPPRAFPHLCLQVDADAGPITPSGCRVPLPNSGLSGQKVEQCTLRFCLSQCAVEVQLFPWMRKAMVQVLLLLLLTRGSCNLLMDRQVAT